MSVINKMLRDLDQRQTPGAGAADPLRRATASVAAVPPPKRSRAVRLAIVLLPLAAALVGGGLWWDMQGVSPTPVAMEAQPPVVVAVPPVASASAAEVLPATDAMASASAPVLAASAASVVAPAAAAPPVAAAMPAVAAAPAPVAPLPAAQAGTSANVGLRMDSKLSSTVLPAPTSKMEPTVAAAAPKAAPDHGSSTPVPAKPAAPSAVDAAVTTRQQLAGREALAQAQSLWASGAKDAAIGTLQEAVAAAERSPSTSGAATLVPMVRELARMQLAEGQAAAAWDLLARMEPLLNNQPELWALRANAAQRLGRHQDSVQAYTMALQLRPGEQRWLLGAAVSLAALGQTSAAAEMAEKARGVGPVSRDVLAYLRQQGVPLTDRP